MKFRTLLLASLVAVPTPTTAQTAAGASGDARLRALYNSEWAWRQEQGLRGNRAGGDGIDHFPRIDAKTQAMRLAYWTKALADLDRIPVDELSPEEKINAAVFRQAVRTLADNARFKTYEAPFNADTFFWDGLTPRTVVVLNEVFASTAVEDARFLGREVLERLIAADVPTVLVTFVDELSRLGSATVSMVSLVDPDDPTVRTLKVVRRAADGRAYADALATRYGLSHDRIVARVVR